jgi:predicted oxidoreductase
VDRSFGEAEVGGADVVVVGAGLAGLVAACEVIHAGRSVVVVDQEGPQSLGGQAHWSFGGLFLVDSPEQRRLRIRDSRELAWQDWLGTAGFDRPEDYWPRRWAESYVDFAAGEMRAWLHGLGVRFFPVVGWAERGGSLAAGHGNSVPRFHVTWGTGPALLAPFLRTVMQAVESGHARLLFRHRVDDILLNGMLDDAGVTGVSGSILEPSDSPRGEASSRVVVGDFSVRAQAVIVTSGGIGGDQDLVRKNWPSRLGTSPRHMLSGVPAHVDGRMLAITERASGRVVNLDRMWHYTEGLQNVDPVWAGHGIRILPGPSSLWLDAEGRRLPPPLFPGFDTLSTLEHLARSGHEHSWFVLTRRILEREFALSGSEQNPDLTGRSLRGVLGRIGGGTPEPVRRFVRHGADVVAAVDVDGLVRKMNALTEAPLLSSSTVDSEIRARDGEMRNGFSKDAQVMAIRSARRYLGDRLIRVARPHRLLDPAAGPLVAVRLRIITRKTLGGLETDLTSRVLRAGGDPVPGLYAAGEVAGFGGGGMHGYRSLEGTFLGGCLFSGRAAGRHAAASIA